jgi:hypothetical protein
MFNYFAALDSITTSFLWLQLAIAAAVAAFLICDSTSFKRFGESLQLTRVTELVCYSAVHAVVTVLVAGSSSVWCGMALLLTTLLTRLIETVHCAAIQAATPSVQVCYTIYLFSMLNCISE